MYVAGIDAFLAIVQTRSLTRAAEVLHLTQATVSYRLKTLEEEIGARLIDRSKGIKTIILTPFGENFVNIAERWGSLKREIAVLQATGPQLSLSIGGSNSLNTYVLPPLYRALIQYDPQIRLQFRTQHSVELYETLERREIDVAFVKMERSLPNIVVKPFYVDEMVLIRAATAGNMQLEPVQPDDLKCEHEIYMNWSPSFNVWHDNWWDPFCSLRIKVDTAGLIFSLLHNSNQWSIVPRSVANEFVKSGRYVIQPLVEQPPGRTCYKITLKNPNSTMKTSLDILDELLAQNSAYKLYSN